MALAIRFRAVCAVQCVIATVAPTSINSAKPRVFVYDLPVDIAIGVPTRDDRQCDELVSGSPDLLNCLFGEEFTVQTELGPLKLRKTDQYAMGRIFLWRIMGSANRVDDPDQADLFFVPYWYADGFPTVWSCPTAVEMLRQLPHLNSLSVGKHIFLSPRMAHCWDVCPFWSGHPWRRGLKIFQVDYSASVDEKFAAALVNYAMKFALEDRNCCWRAVGENMHSIPFPGFGSGLGLDMMRRLEQLRDPHKSRPILVMGAFGMHGDRSQNAKSLREMLAAECKGYGPPICRGLVLKVQQQGNHRHLGLSDNLYTDLVTAMLQSRFCLQPMGDGPERKGIVDSILLGCIPVLFSVNQTRLWPWNLPALANISVLLNITVGSAIDQLKKIDEAHVSKLREAVADAAKSLAYTIQDGTGDAVESALYYAWIHSGGKPPPQSDKPQEQSDSGIYSGIWKSIAVCMCLIVIGVGVGGFMVFLEGVDKADGTGLEGGMSGDETETD